MSATRDPRTADDTSEYGRLDGGADNEGVDRSLVMGRGLRSLSMTCLRLTIVGVFLLMLGWLMGKAWVAVLPVLLALLVSSVLWGPTRWFRRLGLPGFLAALLSVLLTVAAIAGVVAVIAPSVVEQSKEIATQSGEGLQQVQTWLHGPPFNLQDSQLDKAFDTATKKVQEKGDQIANGLFSTVSTVGSVFVTSLLVLVLTFFFLKDGESFLPWLRQVAGRNTGRHLTEVLSRMWLTLGNYIRAQAIVSAIDATIIGLGLIWIGVPMWGALAILTFLAGFVPIVGAVTMGVLAVLVALVSLGVKGAVYTLLLILFVQNVEGNITAPFIQGRSMRLHAGVVLLSVTLGGSLFGIAGAFLAVPLAAVLAVLFRYMDEQIDLRTGDLDSGQINPLTREGEEVAVIGEARHGAFAGRETPDDLALTGEVPDAADVLMDSSRLTTEAGTAPGQPPAAGAAGPLGRLSRWLGRPQR